jgi:hypothetical protein
MSNQQPNSTVSPAQTNGSVPWHHHPTNPTTSVTISEEGLFCRKFREVLLEKL